MVLRLCPRRQTNRPRLRPRSPRRQIPNQRRLPAKQVHHRLRNRTNHRPDSRDIPPDTRPKQPDKCRPDINPEPRHPVSPALPTHTNRHPVRPVQCLVPPTQTRRDTRKRTWPRCSAPSSSCKRKGKCMTHGIISW
jgi:hypothetical protein